MPKPSEITLRRQALELFLLTRSFEEVSRAVHVPKAKIMRWAYEDNWNQVVQRESEATQALASVKIAEAKVDLAQSLVNALKYLVDQYAQEIRPETLTELMEALQKGTEVLNQLIQAPESSHQGPSAKAAVINLIGESRTLFQSALAEIDEIELKE